MKKTIVFTKPHGRYKTGNELTLPSAQAKVLVEALGKATYLDKSLRNSPVVKAPELPSAPTPSTIQAPPVPAPIAQTPPVPSPVASVPPAPTPKVAGAKQNGNKASKTQSTEGNKD